MELSCADFIQKHLHISDLKDFLQDAFKFNNSALQWAILMFVRKNSQDEGLQAILESDEVGEKEKDLIRDGIKSADSNIRLSLEIDKVTKRLNYVIEEGLAMK